MLLLMHVDRWRAGDLTGFTTLAKRGGHESLRRHAKSEYRFMMAEEGCLVCLLSRVVLVVQEFVVTSWSASSSINMRSISELMPLVSRHVMQVKLRKVEQNPPKTCHMSHLAMLRTNAPVLDHPYREDLNLSSNKEPRRRIGCHRSFF